MTGSGMVLTTRDRQVVAAVSELGIMTREQVARHLKFGSTTRANAVLLRLARHGYLERRLQPTLRGSRRLTYHLGGRGAELLGHPIETHRSGWRSVTDLFVEHKLLVNDIRLAFEHTAADGYHLEKWMDERQLKTLQFGFTPDGYAEYVLDERRYAFFLEADNGTESQTRWRQKVAAYVTFAYSGEFERRFGVKRFRVLVIAPSQRRLINIQREIAKQTDRIFWLVETTQLLTLGPFATVFRRPRDPNLHALTQRPS